MARGQLAALHQLDGAGGAQRQHLLLVPQHVHQSLPVGLVTVLEPEYPQGVAAAHLLEDARLQARYLEHAEDAVEGVGPVTPPAARVDGDLPRPGLGHGLGVDAPSLLDVARHVVQRLDEEALLHQFLAHGDEVLGVGNGAHDIAVAAQGAREDRLGQLPRGLDLALHVAADDAVLPSGRVDHPPGHPVDGAVAAADAARRGVAGHHLVEEPLLPDAAEPVLGRAVGHLPSLRRARAVLPLLARVHDVLGVEKLLDPAVVLQGLARLLAHRGDLDVGV